MKVILLNDVPKLGKKYESKDVSAGYARNFLFPNNMALRDSKKNLEYYNNIKEEIKNKEEKKTSIYEKILTILLGYFSLPILISIPFYFSIYKDFCFIQ